MTDVPVGTTSDVYPNNKSALVIPEANNVPFILGLVGFEYKSKGPVLPPALVNVILAEIAISIFLFVFYDFRLI
jgi:hypothetical protein